jgi:hypothetical protein
MKTLMRSDETAEVLNAGSSGLKGFDLRDYETRVEYPSISEHENLSTKTNRSNRPQKFIKGPIDYQWIAKACRVRAAELGIYLMYKIGILGSKASVQVRPSECRELGLTDRERQRQVLRLENAGLITADKGKGRCPTVTLIEHGGSDGEDLIHT